MEGAQGFSQYWVDLIQTAGIVASILLAVWTAWRFECTQSISNSIAITDQHRNLLNDVKTNAPRIFVADADVNAVPISLAEEIGVINFVAHLSTVFRANRYGEFVKLDGLERDVREFFKLPIPNTIWEKLKPFQDKKLVAFVESCLNQKDH
jgi:hypothetical protein